jgi:hypothetical protein
VLTLNVPRQRQRALLPCRVVEKERRAGDRASQGRREATREGRDRCQSTAVKLLDQEWAISFPAEEHLRTSCQERRPFARRFLRRRLAFAVARQCHGASTARVPRPDIAANVEDRNAAAFSMTMRLYSVGLQVHSAIIKVRRAIVSHDASIMSVIIKGRVRLRRRTDLRMVPKNVDWSRGYRWRLVGRCQGIDGSPSGFLVQVFVVHTWLALKPTGPRGKHDMKRSASAWPPIGGKEKLRGTER